MDTYDYSPSQLQQQLSSQVSPSVVNAVLGTFPNASTVTVEAVGTSQTIAPTGTGPTLIVTNNPTVGATLEGDPRGSQGDLAPAYNSATFVSNPGNVPLTILAESSAFYELGNSGSETIIGGDAKTFVVDGSHDTSSVNIQAGSGRSYIIGGPGNDSLSGSTSPTGSAAIVAGSGHTTITGGLGQDTYYGGGQSSITGGAVGQQLLGGYSSGAADTLVAGAAGHETLAVATGHNFIDDRNSAGGDTIFGGTGNDSIDTGANGSLMALHGNTTVSGGSGDDNIFLLKSANTHESIDGGGGNNFVTFAGYSVNDATISTNNAGVTTITFASTGQSATLQHVNFFFAPQDTPHS